MSATSTSAGAANSRVALVASLFLVTVGALVLVGWTFDLAVLKGLWGGITMKANAAVGLLSAGVALALVGVGRRWSAALGRLFAAFAGAIGASTLSEHIVGWDLGIDQLLFPEVPGAVATTSPGRMGPNAATSLALAGVALWYLFRDDRASVARAQIIGAAMTLLALVPIVGYLYGAAQLFAIARFTGIALHTGIALLVLSLGILAARSDIGPVAALTSDEPHSVLARRLLVPAVLLPPLLGYARLVGERHQWYDTGFGLSVMVVAVIVVLSGTIWRSVVVVTRSDEARRQAQRDRDALLVRERAARERAEHADRAKDDFIAALSHELRTPLNAVLGWMQMLQNGAVSDERRARATDAVARNAGVLARLIDDLIDTSRITAGHLQLSRELVDVPSVVQAAAESVMPAAEAKRIKVALSIEPSIHPVAGDPQRLQQVAWNVLSNAIRYSPTGGSVDVRVSMANGAVQFRVADQGAGIDPAFLPYVFDRFRQADSSPTGGQAGLGLGLYIAKFLIERHGGTIRAESEGPGTGAVFTIELPAAEPSIPPALPTSRQAVQEN